LRSHQGNAWFEGDLDAGFVSFGKVAGMIKAVKPVKEIIQDMVG